MNKFQRGLSARDARLCWRPAAARCRVRPSRRRRPGNGGRPLPENVSALSASLRVRCERRSTRSKISVDGNNLSPRNGRFRARVRASGGTVTSASKRAVGDEAEFDFDSNRNDIAQGAAAYFGPLYYGALRRRCDRRDPQLPGTR